MKFVNLSDARKNWAELIDYVEKNQQKICLIKYKTPVAYIVPVGDVYELLDEGNEETQSSTEDNN